MVRCIGSQKKELEIAVYLTAQFVDGKLVSENGYWDNALLVLGIQALESENNISVDEKTIKTAIDAAVKAWNTNDKKLMYSFMEPNITRNTNGIRVQSGTKEYGDLMDLYHNALNDFTVTLNNSNTKRNKAYISWVISGINTGEFMRNLAANKK